MTENLATVVAPEEEPVNVITEIGLGRGLPRGQDHHHLGVGGGIALTTMMEIIITTGSRKYHWANFSTLFYFHLFIYMVVTGRRVKKALFDTPEFKTQKQFAEFCINVKQEDIAEAYKEYQQEYNRRHSRQFFDDHKHEEWFRERYDPQRIQQKWAQRTEKAREAAKEFWLALATNSLSCNLFADDNEYRLPETPKKGSNKQAKAEEQDTAPEEQNAITSENVPEETFVPDEMALDSSVQPEEPAPPPTASETADVRSPRHMKKIFERSTPPLIGE